MSSFIQRLKFRMIVGLIDLSLVTDYAWELLACFLSAVYEYAFTLVHQLDPMSEGRDVLQLKTGLSSMISVRSSFAKCVHFKPLMQSFVAAK